MLHEGDRVRTRMPTWHVAAGAIGTIRRVFTSVSDIYDVQFDTYPISCAVFGDVLEQVSEERKRAVGEKHQAQGR